MLLSKFNNYEDIPGRKIITEKIPVFAAQNYADYLKEFKGHNVVWFANVKENNTVSFLLPFAVIKNIMLRKGYFLTGVLSFDSGNTVEKESEFLESVISYIKKNNLCDWIQQGPNWALFNTVPSGSKAVRFGTYKIFFKDNNEEDILKKMNRYRRKDINSAIRSKVEIKKGLEYLNDCLSIIEDTSREANLYSPSLTEIEKLLLYFKDNLKIYVSYFNNVPQSAAIFLFNKYCMYGLYAGSIAGAVRGSNAYLFWEAIKDGKEKGCDSFDFVGGRINPLPGSKLERIQRFKEQFGSEFVQGYIWKMNFSVIKYTIYQILIRLIYLVKNKKYKPDIIDQELKNKEEMFYILN
jgi:hypothetical protein